MDYSRSRKRGGKGWIAIKWCRTRKSPKGTNTKKGVQRQSGRGGDGWKNKGGVATRKRKKHWEPTLRKFWPKVIIKRREGGELTGEVSRREEFQRL